MNEAPHSTMPDIKMPTLASGFVPTWDVGDSWDVEYVFDSLVRSGGVGNPPKLLSTLRWTYTVREIDDGAVHIDIVNQRRAKTLGEVTVAKTGEIVSLGFLDSIGPVGPEVVNLPRTHGIYLPAGFILVEVCAMAAWPAFPLQPGMEGFEGGAATQWVKGEGAGWNVTMVRNAVYQYSVVRRTADLRWEEGRPWWTSLKITHMSTYEGQAIEDVVVDAHVTRWSRAGAGGAGGAGGAP